MLIEFSVQNFGSIKGKQTLSFEATKNKHLEDYYIIPTKGLRLLKLGLIYGANASGKTTVLQALDFLRNIVLNPAIKKDIPFDFEPFLFDSKTPSQNTIFNISFIQNDIRYEYEVELNKQAIVKEKLDCYNPKKSNIFTRTTNIKNQYTDSIIFGTKIKMNKNTVDTLKINTLWNNTVIGGFAKTNIENKYLKDVKDWFEIYLNPMISTETTLFDYFSEELKKKSVNIKNIIKILKAADFGISNINIKTKEKKFLFEHKINEKTYELPRLKESIGTQRYFELAVVLLLIIKESTMFSIDELEKSLHPDLFEHFLLSFIVNSKKSQIIATTHNREILKDKDIFRNDAIWITDKDKESATELYSLSDFDTSEIRDTTNIYNAYKNGKLGGIPNLSNYYVEADNE